MPQTPYLTAPLKTDKMPPGIPYIIGNEAAERFNFYGMRAVLVVFMTKYLVDRDGALAPMSENDANKWYHLFLSANYFFPALGAIISDAFWGKYKMIIRLSLVYCLGSLVLAFDHTRLGLTLGLTLIAIGAGGIKPCVSSHVGDQFGVGNQHLLARAFGWFYFSVNFGSFFSILLIPVLLDKSGAGLAFGVPAGLMLLATVIFWSGRYKYAHIPPGGKTFLRDTFNREGFATLGRIAIIFVFVAVFWSLWDQSGGEWVTQAEKMDLHFAGINWLSSQIQALNAIMILAFIPLFQYVIYPAINKVYPLTPLRKIGLGLIVTGLSFLVSAWIETQIAAGLKPSIGWQLPAYALLSAGEVMVSITGLEFAYTQAPKHMKAMVQAIYLLAVSAGNLFTALVHVFIANPDGTVKLHGAAYYNFFAALSIGCVAFYVFVAKAYKEKTYLQGEAPAVAA
jgi:POT family proton-dependent oligopeptide transporter